MIRGINIDPWRGYRHLISIAKHPPPQKLSGELEANLADKSRQAVLNGGLVAALASKHKPKAQTHKSAKAGSGAAPQRRRARTEH
uniref:Uncharacterized protein n=1 Tax=Oryza punctata TaxID=4537 RepID=A0A0E0KID8_ORYPU